MSNFTHLHVHSEYSIFDGISRIKDLVSTAKNFGMNSIAVTDHGNMHGAIDLYTECIAQGIKPILGSEVYVAINDYKIKDQSERSPHHMTILAKNNVGYSNLVKLLTIANTKGIYYRPRIDKELLLQYKEGLIILSGCPSGEISRLIVNEGYDKAKEIASWYSDNFPDYYLEIMRHKNVDNLDSINENLIKMSKDTGIPLVATNDSHYTKLEDNITHDVCLCIQTNSQINDPSRLKFEDPSYYVKSSEEMYELFSDIPDAVSNSQLISDMCEISLDLETTKIPEFKIEDGSDPWDYLQKICAEGFLKLFPNPDEKYRERMRYELDVIKQTNYADYFLAVWDIAKYSTDNNILFNVRGSAAASLVLYSLGVTLIDPLEYNLVFERFLNLERKEMPDVDLDFQDNKREKVLQYVVEKYGIEHVAQIITFGTYGARGSIRDVGRVSGIDYSELDPIAKAVPFGPNMNLETALQSKDMKAFLPRYKNVLDIARSIEGLVRHSSTHAAAVVISEFPLNEFIPLQISSKTNKSDILMTQYAMDPVAKLGLLKMDFLGLSNLTMITECFDLIKKTKNIDLTIDSIDLEDQKTFELLSSGKTLGVFQLEGDGMTRYIQQLKPSSLNDVSAMIALYRPGPMEQIPKFIEGKHGKIPTYIHKVLEKNLEETYGVIVYQDQVLYIFREMAGYSLGEADIVRKSMGKKIPEIMIAEKNKFISRCISNGYEENLASEVFNLIEPFAGYAFNKAHSVSYALISYVTAYLKTHFLEEFLTTSMNLRINDSDSINKFVQEAKSNDIEVKPPNLNTSMDRFAFSEMDGNKHIIFGLNAIKNVGSNVSKSIVSVRDSVDKFKSLEEVFENIDSSIANSKTFESLIKVGALDDFGDRSAILNKLEDLLAVSISINNAKRHNQVSMFAFLPEDQKVSTEIKLDKNIITNPIDKQIWEKELIGVKISVNLANERLIQNAPDEYITSREQIEKLPNDQRRNLKILGQPISIERLTYTDKNTNQPKTYFKSRIDLLDSEIETVCFNQNFNQISIWDNHELVVLEASARNRNNQLSIYFNDATKYEPINGVVKPNDNTKCLSINIKSIGNDDDNYKNLINTLEEYKGEIPVYIQLNNENIIGYEHLQVSLEVKDKISSLLNGYCDVEIKETKKFIIKN